MPQSVLHHSSHRASPPRTRRCRARAAVSALATALGAVVASVLVASPASAHHGWDEFDTTRAYYISGTISEIDLGYPHSHVTIALDGAPVPDGFSQRELPAEIEQMGTRDSLEAVRPYDQDEQELELVLPDPDYLDRWGMGELADGDWLEMVGFVNADHPTEYRPEVVWREDGPAIRQRLGTLPQQPVPPGSEEQPASPSLSGPGTSGTERSEPGSSQGPSAEDGASDGVPAAAVWGGVAAVVVVIATGGAVYLRRQAKK